MKKNLLQLICILLAIPMLTACNGDHNTPSDHSSKDTVAPIIWHEPDNVIFANYQVGSSAEATGYDLGTEEVQVGRMDDGKPAFAFLRLPLGGDFFADEVTEARLFMKVTGGHVPEHLDICLLTDQWTPVTLTNSETQGIMAGAEKHRVQIRPEADDWISFPITDEVKTWLCGDVQNSGIALMTGDDAYFSFDSGGRSDGEESPYIAVTGKRGNRPDEYGKFGFTRYPDENSTDGVDANCLSYVLRDSYPVYIDDFGGDIDEINRIYAESGEDAVADYIGGLIEDYVEANKEGLQISNFRRLTGFDDAIDGKNEYRIALRVGCHVLADQQGKRYIDPRGFDFHLWAQLNDGRWTQKFPADYSEIIPGTVPDISPQQFIWNSARQWGIEKWMNYYTSKVIFYAVTKDTGEFTRHKD